MKKIALIFISMSLLISNLSMVQASQRGFCPFPYMLLTVAGGCAFYANNWYKKNISPSEKNFADRESKLKHINDATLTQYADMRPVHNSTSMNAKNNSMNINEHFKYLEDHKDSGPKFKDSLKKWKQNINKVSGGKRADGMDFQEASSSMGYYALLKNDLEEEKAPLTTRKWQFWGTCVAGLCALAASLNYYFQ